MSDRNFDDLADRFEQRIYGRRKGKIRQVVIERDLLETIPIIKKQNPLRVLDLGAGLGQFAIWLAEQGHDVTYNDISISMMKKAQAAAKQKHCLNQITWSHYPYQQLIKTLPSQSFDLILCHALLEWLDNPQELIAHIKPLLKNNAFLSLCFYNPKGLVYHNLMRGNFHSIKRGSTPQSNSQGFTPNKPCDFETVKHWLNVEALTIRAQSGIRVFSDYTRETRGGLASEEEVLAMELEYSNRTPYWQLGRYIHLIADNSH